MANKRNSKLKCMYSYRRFFVNLLSVPSTVVPSTDRGSKFLHRCIFRGYFPRYFHTISIMKTNLVKDLQKMFFEMASINNLTEYLDKLNSESISILAESTIQDDLVKQTAELAHFKHFPSEKNYSQKFFLKIIRKIESTGNTVSDVLYDAFGEFFKNEFNNDLLFHKTYCLFEKYITIAEQLNIVTNGTTGLRSWDAGKILTQWCLSHKDIFINKNILEVASGVGLTGISICSLCNPKSYIFSDFHQKVLQVLFRNAYLNLNETPKHNNTNGDCCTACSNISRQVPEPEKFNFDSTSMVKENVHVIKLDLQNFHKTDFHLIPEPDIILAADICYDDALNSSFVKIISQWLQVDYPNCVVYTACTIRNQSTTDNFIELIRKERLNIREMTCDFDNWFHLVYNIPVKIYKICSRNSSLCND